MNEPNYFDSDTANGLWKNYFSAVDQCLVDVPDEHAQTIRNELASHAFEAVRCQSRGTELEKLKNSLAKLGPPKEIVPPMVAAVLNRNTAKSHHSNKISSPARFQLGRSFLSMIRAVSIGITSLFGLTFLLMAFLKPFRPANVGLFTNPGDVGLMHFSFGLIGDTENMQEHLGFGFIPLVLLLSLIFFKLSMILLKNINA